MDDGSTALSVLMKMNALHRVTCGRLGHQAGAAHVRPHGGRDVRLRQRDVLLRRGVEDDVGALRLEDARHRGLVGHVADDRAHLGRPETPTELLVDVEERRLGPLEEHDATRAQRRDLAAQLGADAAAGAGDEDRSAGHQLAHRPGRDVDRLTTQQVLHAHRAHAVDGHGLVEQLVDGRERPDGRPRGLAHGDHLAQPIAADAGHGHDDLDHLPLAHDARQLLRPAHDVDAVDLLAVLLAVVVQEGDGLQAQRPVAAHLAHEHGAGLTRAVDEHRARRSGRDGRPALVDVPPAGRAMRGASRPAR